MGSLFSQQGLNPHTLQWKWRVLNSGLPRKSLYFFFGKSFFFFFLRTKDKNGFLNYQKIIVKMSFINVAKSLTCSKPQKSQIWRRHGVDCGSRGTYRGGADAAENRFGIFLKTLHIFQMDICKPLIRQAGFLIFLSPYRIQTQLATHWYKSVNKLNPPFEHTSPLLAILWRCLGKRLSRGQCVCPLLSRPGRR